jgi:hypothetical protein
MFVGKARSLPLSGAILDYAGKACKRFEHSSLSRTFINYSGATTLRIMTISITALSITINKT